MKLTYKNRKWLLAAGLIAILGTNLSNDFNRFEQKYSTIELSSELGESSEDADFEEMEEQTPEKPADTTAVRGGGTRKTGPVRPADLGKENETTAKTSEEASKTSESIRTNKIYTSKGVLKVRYLEGDSDNETLAIVQRSQTEGQSCNDCFETIHLGMSNKSDIEQLNDALMEKIAKSEKTEVAPSKKTEIAESDAEMDTIEETEVARDNVFDKVISQCSSKSAMADKLSCLSDGMIKLMRSKNAKVTNYEATTFFINEVQPLLVSQIAEARQKLSNLNSQSNSTAELLFSSQVDLTSRREAVNELRRTIEKMIAKIPTKYEDIRAKVVSIESHVLKMEVNSFHEVNAQAKNTTDPNIKLQLTTQATDRFATTKLLADLLMDSSAQAVRDASNNGLMDMKTTEIYNKFIQDFKTQFYANLSNPQAQVTTTTVEGANATITNNNPVIIQGAQELKTQDGRTVIILPAGVNMMQRVQSPGRGLQNQPTVMVAQPAGTQTIILQPEGTSIQQQTNSVVVSPQPLANTATVLTPTTTADPLAARAAMQAR